MIPEEEIYQKMLKALKPFKGHVIHLDTYTEIQDAIMDILVEALPSEDIRKWIKVEPRVTKGTTEIGVYLFSHPDPPDPVAHFIEAMRGHGFRIVNDLGKFDDSN